ncbi:MAG: hypothetical protein R3B06_04645 [Kofleriaceae bacterium]
MTARWIAVVLVVGACGRRPDAPPRVAPADAAPVDVAVAPIDAADAADAAVDWRTGYDFDGDGRPDRITDEFTGGAHCCYRLTIHASASGASLAVPFDLDGGNPGGIAASPGVSAVVGPDGRAQLRVQIATYAGQREPLPVAWRQAWHLRRNQALVGVVDGTLTISPAPWTCDDALDAVAARRFTGWDGWPNGCDDPALAARLAPTVEAVTSAQLGKSAIEVSRAVLRTPVETGGSGDAPVAADRIVSYLDGVTVARVDIDVQVPVAELVADLGPPPHRLPYAWWGLVEPRGLWLWPAQGIAAYVDHAGRTARRLLLFPATDRAGFEARVARPLDADAP